MKKAKNKEVTDKKRQLNDYGIKEECSFCGRKRSYRTRKCPCGKEESPDTSRNLLNDDYATS